MKMKKNSNIQLQLPEILKKFSSKSCIFCSSTASIVSIFKIAKMLKELAMFTYGEGQAQRL